MSEPTKLLKQSNITSTWESITPEKAIKYLETARTEDGYANRTVRQNKVEAFMNLIRNGMWQETHQGIAFDEEGRLCDGQKRLWAVVETGQTVRCMVSRGLNKAQIAALDLHQPRDYADTAHYQGWNPDPITSSIARIMVNSIEGRSRTIPFEVLKSWYEFYQPGIDFAIKVRLESRPRTGKSMTVNMATPIARAYYHYPDKIDLLVKFGAILKSGQYDHAADRAAFTLREVWLANRLGNIADQYYKTEGALRAFMERRPIRKLQRPEGELFTIPKLPASLRYVIKNTSESPRSGVLVRKRLRGELPVEA